MSQRPGRNDPCPCGSGKKFKKCCIDRMPSGPASHPAHLHDHYHQGHDYDLDHDHDHATCEHHGHVEVDGRRLYRQTDLEGMKRPGAPRLIPYTIAKMTEDASLPKMLPHLRAGFERHQRSGWTIARVAGMTTEAIEEQLRAFGVNHTTDRFLQLAEGLTEAWRVSDVWLKTDRITCKEKDTDFLGLAACELWKRLIPDRPSIEMLDDWMEDGYKIFQRDFIGASEIWWKLWRTVHSRFTRAMRRTEDTQAVFAGSQSLFNWCQDFEMTLENAAARDPKYGEIGIQFVTEFVTQFPDEEDLLLVNMNKALAGFLLQQGRVAEGLEQLHQIVERWPTNVWGYVALADAYAGKGRFADGVPVDLPRAISILEQGLAAGEGDEEEVNVLTDRLEKLRHLLASTGESTDQEAGESRGS